MYRNPLEQFMINDIFTISFPILSGNKFSLTNIGLYLIISIVLILIVSQMITGRNTLDKAGSIIGNKGILIKESLYDTVNKIVKDQIGIENQIYLPYLYSLFLLILTSNIIGLVPYNFTSTSHLEMQDDSFRNTEIAS